MSASTSGTHNLDEKTFSRLVNELPVGKRVAQAVYVHVESLSEHSEVLMELVDRLRDRVGADSRFNVVKLSPSVNRLSFLAYPNFFQDPHPCLEHSITVDLSTGRFRRHDYDHRENPPILHRKEALVGNSHPLAATWKELTEAEEREGLYQNTKTIGFLKNWQALLTEKKLAYEGHRLVRAEGSQPVQDAPREHSPAVQVDRHKTAIARYRLSKPIQTLMDNELLSKATPLLDYGCGRGDDLRHLDEMGYSVSGWDPVHFPHGKKEPADIVNLGFVINVIEEPTERMEVLQEAFGLTRSLLVVSVIVAGSSATTTGRRYKDGILTSRSTFQKYFEQQELERYLEDVLEVPPVAAGLGIFYVFRHPEDQQRFLANRSRRTLDCKGLSGRLQWERRDPSPRRVRHEKPRLYETHKELLDAFGTRMLELARLPLRHEFDRYDEIEQVMGSAQKAKNFILRKLEPDALSRAVDSRRNDLLVYFALSHFRRKVPVKHLPESLKMDVKALLGGYKRAMDQGQELLFSAGNPEIVSKLCDETPFGFLDPQALFIHWSLLGDCHPILRIYVGCADVLCGAVQDAHIIKIHKRSGKVSLLQYDDFEGNPLPELQQRIKVSLKSRSVQVFDHRSQENQQVLYFKERYVARSHPEREKWEEFTSFLQGSGLDLETGYGPSRQELEGLVPQLGLAGKKE